MSTVVERFEAKLSPQGECWVWTKGSRNGYPTFYADGKTVSAHRWSYEYHRADIPEGLTLDHLCRVPMCVNAWHLEPVTRAVNTRRAYEAKAECKRGHPRDGLGYCRPCFSAAHKRYRFRQKYLG